MADPRRVSEHGYFDGKLANCWKSRRLEQEDGEPTALGVGIQPEDPYYDGFGLCLFCNSSPGFHAVERAFTNPVFFHSCESRWLTGLSAGYRTVPFSSMRHIVDLEMFLAVKLLDFPSRMQSIRH